MSDTAEKPKTRRTCLLVVATAVVLVCVVGAIAGGLGGFGSDTDGTPRPTRTPRPTNTPRPEDTPVPTATPAPTAEPYAVIAANVESMTEAQWKAYLPTLEGQQVVNWQGWVVEVDAKSGGRYELWVDMDSPEDLFSTQDVYFAVPEDIALTINKDQEVVFSGIIDSVTEFMGSVSFRLEDVTFELR